MLRKYPVLMIVSNWSLSLEKKEDRRQWMESVFVQLYPQTETTQKKKLEEFFHSELKVEEPNLPSEAKQQLLQML